MADFEIIEDIQKVIPKGKDFKKMLPFIVAGAGIGVVALFMKRSSASSSTQAIPSGDGVGSDIDVDGVMTDYANQLNETIKANNSALTDYYNGQFEDLAGGLYDVIQSQNTLINNLRTDLSKQLEDVKGDQKVPVYSQATIIQQWTGSAPSETAGSSIYFDQVDDDIQYNNLVKNITTAISTGQITGDQANKLKLEVAGLGNNGVGWTPENYDDNKKRLQSDPSYVQSEIERAQLVIENRSKSGLSTKTQEDYLKRLQSGDEMK